MLKARSRLISALDESLRWSITTKHHVGCIGGGRPFGVAAFGGGEPTAPPPGCATAATRRVYSEVLSCFTPDLAIV